MLGMHANSSCEHFKWFTRKREGADRDLKTYVYVYVYVYMYICIYVYVYVYVYVYLFICIRECIHAYIERYQDGANTI